MLSRVLLGSALFLGAVGCTEDNDDPSIFTLDATGPDSTFSGWSTSSRFAVGLRSELQVRDTYTRMITGLACTAGCRVDVLPSVSHPLFSSYRVTPLEKTFRVHVSVVGRHGRESPDVTFDRDLTAVETTLATTQDGAGPGLPFLTGMTVTWRLGVKDEDIAWEPALSTLAVTGPFDAVPRRPSPAGIDVDIRATARGRGTLIHRNGGIEVRHELVAFDPSEIQSLSAVRVPEKPITDLRSALAGRLVVSKTESTKVWVVFETADGIYGIGGAGESLPAPGAHFSLRVPGEWSSTYQERDLTSLQSQAQLVIEPKSYGTSELLLRIGAVQGVAEVVVQ